MTKIPINLRASSMDKVAYCSKFPVLAIHREKPNSFRDMSANYGTSIHAIFEDNYKKGESNIELTQKMELAVEDLNSSTEYPMPVHKFFYNHLLNYMATLPDNSVISLEVVLPLFFIHYIDIDWTKYQLAGSHYDNLSCTSDIVIETDNSIIVIDIKTSMEQPLPSRYQLVTYLLSYLDHTEEIWDKKLITGIHGREGLRLHEWTIPELFGKRERLLNQIIEAVNTGGEFAKDLSHCQYCPVVCNARVQNMDRLLNELYQDAEHFPLTNGNHPPRS